MKIKEELESKPQTIFLKDYKESVFVINQINLIFEIDYEMTLVSNTMKMSLKEKGVNTLFLNGENLELIEVSVDDIKLVENKDYKISKKGMTITANFNEDFIIKIKNKINPKENTDLQGLYISGDLLCTQNEPEGFRNITYYLDRPDCMSVFQTKIIGNKKRFPIMLSNGNKVDFGDLDNGKHFVVWEDPSLKPSYLFALVAGKMGMIEDSYKTLNGNKVKLEIYCDLGNEDKCTFAMTSLKKSMKWDEDTFGLIYDLDIYMIVAVDSFNFGAMENKGLNIFNSAYVLADRDSATDNDYAGIEGVIGHEYFHNWTGNRVTCRDWFQLTLKEGLTVFRDQSFSGDMNSKVVQRISDVQRLQNGQFPEDSGPTSHPIKPKSYMEINNFYTHTIYEKGAEVIRMIHTLLGDDGFKKGMKLYFKRHDGQAVTTEDFVNAMSDANDFDLSDFLLWYHQCGTPEINIKEVYSKKDEKLTLEIEQNCSSLNNQKLDKAFYMPYRIGLLCEDNFKIETKKCHLRDDIFILNNKKQKIIFSNLKSKPILSLNRSFSAPVKTNFLYDEKELAIILASDSDLFNRYQASQSLALRTITNNLNEFKNNKVTGKFENIASEIYLDALGSLILNNDLDLSLKSRSLELPTIGNIGQLQQTVDYKAIHDFRTSLYRQIGKKYEDQIFSQFTKLNNECLDYKFYKDDVAKREYKNTLLKYLFLQGSDQYINLVNDQYYKANNMNDRFFAMQLISNLNDKRRDEVLSHFYQEWKNNILVICKWFSVQSASTANDTFKKIRSLENDHIFDFKVPNHVSALWGNFCRNNFLHFHKIDGSGYQFLKEKIIFMDQVNSRVASSLCNSFRDYNKLPELQMNLMKIELQEIHQTKGLSKDSFEIINKILK